MFSSKYFSYLFIIIGCVVAVYAQADEQQNTVVLIVGIVVLMYGLFRVYKAIPDKIEKDEEF